MKSMTHAVVLFAAAAMAQIASAQAVATFTTPFAFATPSGQMPAGKYEVEIRSTGTSTPIVMLKHEASRQRNLFVAAASSQSTSSPRIDFSCVNGDDCRLQRVAMRGAAFHTPARKARPEARLYTVYMTAPVSPSGE